MLVPFIGESTLLKKVQKILLVTPPPFIIFVSDDGNFNPCKRLLGISYLCCLSPVGVGAQYYYYLLLR